MVGSFARDRDPDHQQCELRLLNEKGFTDIPAPAFRADARETAKRKIGFASGWRCLSKAGGLATSEGLNTNTDRKRLDGAGP